MFFFFFGPQRIICHGILANSALNYLISETVYLSIIMAEHWCVQTWKSEFSHRKQPEQKNSTFISKKISQSSLGSGVLSPVESRNCCFKQTESTMHILDAKRNVFAY